MRLKSSQSGFVKTDWLLLAIVVLAIMWVVFSPGDNVSAFDLSKSSIPKADILSGGPPKDGIPAILSPKFLKPSEAGFLKDHDRVIAIEIGGEAKVYPVKILNWHEVVNDTLNSRPVVITFCPLCGTGIAFDPKIKGKAYTFGVSGLLYQSDLLFYDHQTESLWSQIHLEAVTGKMLGTKLKQIPVLHTTWGSWKKKYPDTLVLSTKTGYSRDYQRDPYQGYEKERGLIFPVKKRDDRYHPKEWVMGVRINGVARAYPFSELRKSPEVFSDKIGGMEVKVQFDKASSTASLTDKDGKQIATTVGFWFAWFTFNSDTELFTAK